MNHERSSFTPISEEERKAISLNLKSQGGVWTEMPPDYATFNRSRSVNKIDSVYKVISTETSVDPSQLEEAYLKTLSFTHRAFDHFESKGTNVLGREVDRAFVVPLRDGPESSKDSRPFYPLLDPRFGADEDIRLRSILGVPPTVIDTAFKSNNEGEAGVLVYAPLFARMVTDIRPDRNNIDQSIQLMKVGAEIIKATAFFAHEQVGARVIGLGATIPKMTDFGKALKAVDPVRMDKLVTTTGHGGTVYMVVETVKKLLEEAPIEDDGRLGIIGGAGSIGWASTVTALDMLEGRQIYAFDRNNDMLREKASQSDDKDSIFVEESLMNVINKTNIIISAITSRIDLDKEDPRGELDLRGKVIIDDSQPGCFSVEQVEARGGKLVWVVGEDGSESEFMTRDGIFTDGIPYNYGERAGLYGEKSDFGCGLEAAVVAKFAAYDEAIRGPVTPENVRAIGRLFLEAGVRVAPFQAYSQPVYFSEAA